MLVISLNSDVYICVCLFKFIFIHFLLLIGFILFVSGKSKNFSVCFFLERPIPFDYTDVWTSSEVGPRRGRSEVFPFDMKIPQQRAVSKVDYVAYFLPWISYSRKIGIDAKLSPVHLQVVRGRAGPKGFYPVTASQPLPRPPQDPESVTMHKYVRGPAARRDWILDKYHMVEISDFLRMWMKPWKHSKFWEMPICAFPEERKKEQEPPPKWGVPWWAWVVRALRLSLPWPRSTPWSGSWDPASLGWYRNKTMYICMYGYVRLQCDAETTEKTVI